MFKYLQIMSARYYEIRYMFFKILPRQSWHVSLTQRQNCVIFGKFTKRK